MARAASQALRHRRTSGHWRAAEFADVVAFLMRARSSYLTGTAINVDGRLSAAV